MYIESKNIRENNQIPLNPTQDYDQPYNKQWKISYCKARPKLPAPVGLSWDLNPAFHHQPTVCPSIYPLVFHRYPDTDTLMNIHTNTDADTLNPYRYQILIPKSHTDTDN